MWRFGGCWVKTVWGSKKTAKISKLGVCKHYTLQLQREQKSGCAVYPLGYISTHWRFSWEILQRLQLIPKYSIDIKKLAERCKDIYALTFTMELRCSRRSDQKNDNIFSSIWHNIDVDGWHPSEGEIKTWRTTFHSYTVLYIFPFQQAPLGTDVLRVCIGYLVVPANHSKLNFANSTQMWHKILICNEFTFDISQYVFAMFCFHPASIISTKHPLLCREISTRHPDPFHPASRRKIGLRYLTFWSMPWLHISHIAVNLQF